MKILRSVAFAVVLSFVGAASVHAQVTPGEAAGPRGYWLVITGLSGEPEIATNYNGWSRAIADAARARFGATRVVRMAEDTTAGSVLSTKANIEAQLRQIAAESNADDALFIILIGHGAAADAGPRIALPGPDLGAEDVAKILDGVAAHVTVVNTASASGAWVAPLAAKGRLIVTATKSGVEQNETTFAQYFAAALAADGADTDKDNRVSVLEAFDYAKREVARAYAADKRMLTEHAQIDGDGDGKAVAAATVDSPDGAVASLTFFGTAGAAAAAASTKAQTPELRALYAEKTQLEQKLAQLRARKAEIADAEYQKQLEALLLEISVNGAAIRRLEAIK
jgi:hypothetical protein